MFRSNELERLYRDVRCGGFHPGNDALTHEMVGKITLGIAAEPILVRVAVAGRLDEADHRGVERGEAAHERLGRDSPRFEDGPRRRRP